MSASTRARVAIASCILLIALPGCAAAPDPEVSATPSATAAATPTTFGACDTFFDLPTVAAALGGSTDAQVLSSELLLATVGGVDCGYLFGETALNGVAGAQDSGYVYVTVAPRAIADLAAVEASLTPANCAPEPNIPVRWSAECSAIVTVGDWWYRLRVNSYASESALRTSFDAITKLLESTLQSSVASDHANVVQPFDCASADTGDVPVVGLAREYPATDEIATAAYLLAAPATCRFAMPNDELWDLRVYPGGTAAYDQCTQNNWRELAGSSISVAGVTSAFAFAPQPNDLGMEACATDGKSTVNIWRSFPYSATDSSYVWDEASLAALGSILVPVFAAAVPVTSLLTASSTATTPPGTVPPLTDGGCESLFDATTLALLTGGESGLENVAPDYPLLATVGGINCRYWAQDESGEGKGYAVVSVAPSSIINADELRASLTPAHCPIEAELAADPHLVCNATVALAGWWYSIRMERLGTVEEQQASFAAVTASLEHTLRAADAPRAIGATHPFDCKDANTTGLSMARWRQALTNFHFPNFQPGISSMLSPVSAAAFHLTGPVTCQYTMPSGEPWELTVYQGSASTYDQCTHMGYYFPGSPISVVGVNSAFMLPGFNEPSRVCATDGTSTIEVVRPFAYDYTEDTSLWPQADLGTLSDVLVPVFAAID